MRVTLAEVDARSVPDPAYVAWILCLPFFGFLRVTVRMPLFAAVSVTVVSRFLPSKTWTLPVGAVVPDPFTVMVTLVDLPTGILFLASWALVVDDFLTTGGGLTTGVSSTSASRVTSSSGPVTTWFAPDGNAGAPALPSRYRVA